MEQEPKKPVGRPRKPERDRLKLSQVRVTDDERQAFAEAARRLGMSYSEFLRQAAREALEKSVNTDEKQRLS